MIGSSKFLLGAALCAIVGLGANTANAAEADIAATLTASPAVTMTKDSDFDFASVDFVAGTGIGLIELGPDAGIAFNGANTDLTLSGVGTAGQISVTSIAGVIDVTCDATGIISDGTRQILMPEIKWDQSATTYAAAANTCSGLGVGAVSINTGVLNNPVLSIGAQLNVTVGLLDGSGGGTPYDTASGTGDPVTFRVVYQ